MDPDSARGDELLQRLETLLSNIAPEPGPTETRQRYSGPAQIRDYLYLGGCGDATSLGLLSGLGVTHLLNCAGSVPETGLSRSRSGRRTPTWGGGITCGFGGTSSIRCYHQLEADDTENYDMLKHVTEARRVIGQARAEGGKVLVYCVKGVNRSAMLCIAYLMLEENLELIEAVDLVAKARGRILTNPGFRRQLVTLALM